MKIFKIFGYIFSFAVFGSTIWLYSNRQDVIDWWRLKDYQPSSAVVQLAESASFNDEARKLFYVHDPDILEKEDFTGKCSNSEETIILGCYITNTKIYIFDVTDDRLEGVEQVTAAHEMLHAAYDRLSSDEKSDIDKLLRQVFENSKNTRLAETISTYEARDPSVVPNELHSILGTEVRVLPQELEDYYSRYFNDRSSVVTLAEAYEEEFTKRENQIEEYDKQLRTLNTEITSREANLTQLSSSLESESNLLNSLKSNPEAYNSAIPSYNAKVREFNNLLTVLKSKIDEYNSIVELRNAIATEEQELQKAIDTRAIEI